MNNTTPVRSTCGQQLSAGLKERLKKSGRYHFTPPSAKRQCLSGRDQDIPTISPLSRNPLRSSQDALETNPILKSSPVNKPPLDNATICESPLVHSRGDNSVFSNSSSRKSFGSRRVSTSLCFKSPVIQRVQSVARADTSTETSPEASASGRIIQSPDLSVMPSDTSASTNTPVSTKLKVHTKSKLKNKLDFCDGDDSRGAKGNECAYSPVGGNINELKREKLKLSKDLAEAEEKLRKLRMVKMYRSKNNLDKLEKLIDKWRSMSQQAVTDLHDMLPEPRPALSTFVQHLQIDPDLLQLDIEED